MSSSTSYADLLTAYDAATGSFAWSKQAPAGNVSWGAPTAANGIVYLGATGPGAAAYAIRESDGSVLWTQSVAGDSVSPPAVTAQGVYFVGSTGQGGSPSETLAFDPLLGTLLWQQPVGSGDPVVTDGHLLVGNVSLSPSTGAMQGPIASGPSGWEFADPAVANNVAFTVHWATGFHHAQCRRQFRAWQHRLDLRRRRRNHHGADRGRRARLRRRRRGGPVRARPSDRRDELVDQRVAASGRGAARRGAGSPHGGERDADDFLGQLPHRLRKRGSALCLWPRTSLRRRSTALAI